MRRERNTPSLERAACLLLFFAARLPRGRQSPARCIDRFSSSKCPVSPTANPPPFVLLSSRGGRVQVFCMLCFRASKRKLRPILIDFSTTPQTSQERKLVSSASSPVPHQSAVLNALLSRGRTSVTPSSSVGAFACSSPFRYFPGRPLCSLLVSTQTAACAERKSLSFVCVDVLRDQSLHAYVSQNRGGEPRTYLGLVDSFEKDTVVWKWFVFSSVALSFPSGRLPLLYERRLLKA